MASHGSDLCTVVDYANTTKVPDGMLKKLCLQIFGHARVIGHWCELAVPEGWCGFGAVDWLLGKLALPVPTLSQDEIQPRILQIQEIAGHALWDEIWNIDQKCPRDRWQWVVILRQEFLYSQIASPTIPVVHAGGHEDAALLKIRGRIASVLIAKGHQAAEAINVAESLTAKSNVDLKQLTHQKEDQIYSGIVEKCKRSGIEIQQTAQMAAASRLQKFFKSKQQVKKGPTVNFRLQDVSFPANAFANPSGEQLIAQDNWTILTRGVAIADPVEVQEAADAGRLISTECCGALTLVAIKTSGLITC